LLTLVLKQYSLFDWLQLAAHLAFLGFIWWLWKRAVYSSPQWELCRGIFLAALLWVVVWQGHIMWNAYEVAEYGPHKHPATAALRYVS
jgi:hypothetical protein